MYDKQWYNNGKQRYMTNKDKPMKMTIKINNNNNKMTSNSVGIPWTIPKAFSHGLGLFTGFSKLKYSLRVWEDLSLSLLCSSVPGTAKLQIVQLLSCGSAPTEENLSFLGSERLASKEAKFISDINQ